MKHTETLHVCSNNLYNRIGGKYTGGGTADARIRTAPEESSQTTRFLFPRRKELERSDARRNC